MEAVYTTLRYSTAIVNELDNREVESLYSRE